MSNIKPKYTLIQAPVFVEFVQGTSAIRAIRVVRKLYRVPERFVREEKHRHRRRNFQFDITDQDFAAEFIREYVKTCGGQALVRVSLAPDIMFDVEAEALVAALAEGYEGIKRLARSKFDDVVGLLHEVELLSGYDTPISETTEHVLDSYERAGMPIRDAGNRDEPFLVIHVPKTTARGH
jgi:hypothetical protein